ncbi:MAG: tetratricopeptide repeat protein [Deltaproteobacteria bacterium]|nr:tetratricopeptide repeat protein [Deltaproteobacteria bacterium]
MPLDKTPRYHRVREALGRIYDQQPQHLTELLRKYESDSTSRVFAPLAEAYRKMGRFEEAISICQKGLENHPEFYSGRVTLARCYMDKRLYNEAQIEFETVVRQAPNNLLAHRSLGDVFVARGDTSNALHSYKMAMKLAPDDVELAQKIHDLETNKEAVTVAPPTDIASTTQPSSVAHWEMGGWISEQEWLQGIESELERRTAAEREESDRRILDLLSLGEQPEQSAVDASLGESPADEQEAYQVEHISHVFDRERNNPEITTETLADLYFAQGQYEKSLRIFEKLQATYPSSSRGSKIDICRLRLGVNEEAILRARKIETLRTLLLRVQQLNKDS